MCNTTHKVLVWILMKRPEFGPAYFFFKHVSMAFMLFQGSHALFTGPTNLFFSKTFIKNGSHDTIYIFKNYFAIVFSIFSFYQNKWYPNTPKVFVWQRLFLPTYFTILLIFVTIYGSHCTFLYYSWVPLYYFN